MIKEVSILSNQKELEAKIKEFELYKERMEYAFSGSTDGLWDWNIITDEAYFSPRWKAIIGYEDHEIENVVSSWSSSVHPDDLPLAQEALEKVFSMKEEFYEVEFRQKHKEGHYVWILARATVQFNEVNTPVRMIGTHTDITQRKEAELALKESEKNYAKAQAISHLGNWTWNILTNDLEWSDEVFRILGEEPQSFRPSYEVFLSYIHKDDVEMLTQSIQDSLEDKTIPYDVVHRVITNEKQLRYVHEMGELFYDTNGLPIQMIGTIHDITIQRENQESSLKYQRLLELSAETTSLAFWEYDFKTNNFLSNDLYYRFLATTAEAEGGYIINLETYLDAFIPEKSQPKILDSIERAFTKESDYTTILEYEMRRRDGVILPVEINCYFAYDSYGKPDKAYGTKYNLSDQKEREKELTESKERVEKLLDEQTTLLSLFDKGDAVLFKWKNDHNWSTEYVSNSAKNLLSLSMNSFTSTNISYSKYIHKDDLERVSREVTDAIKENVDFFQHQPYRIVTQNNQIKWVMDYTATEKDAKGNITHFIGYIIDITEMKLSEKKIKNYLTLIDENIISSSTDLYGTITEISTAFSKLTGYTKSEFIGKNHRVLRDLGTSDETYEEMWNILLENKIWKGELKNIRKDRSSYWVDATIFPIFDDDGIKTGYIAIRQDITDKKMIEELSITDDLTKLYNRRHFNELFENEINRSKREKSNIAFLMFDVDNFKLYNDNYGHQEGDKVLVEIAKTLKEFTYRAADSVFRLGGEEFGVIFVSDSIEKIEAHVIHLIETVEALKIPHRANSVSQYVTASAGLVFKNNDEIISANELYKNADDALYIAKENGKNQVFIV